jgi:hypothetical protein
MHSAPNTMTTPDDIQLPTPETLPTASLPPALPAAVVAEAQIVPTETAEPIPTETAEPIPAEAPVEAPAAAEPAKPAKVVRKPKPAISDETLAHWQAKLAAENAVKQRAARAATAARERAEAFRELRAALRRLDAPPAEPADDLAELRADRLAMDVHEAPEHVRTVLAATLRMLTAKRGRR